jgi:hypothetical protein
MPLILVCGNRDLRQGEADAKARGAVKLSVMTYAMPDKQQLWVVWRFDHLPPFRGGKLKFIKGSDYDDPPEGMSAIAEQFWLENHENFERFIAEGHAEWVEQ